MAFMEPDIYFGEFYTVSADHGGTFHIPVEVCGVVATNGDLQMYVEGSIDDPDDPPILAKGWIARMSAPGYMDCTDWSVHPTEADAREHLREMYGDDDETTDEADEPTPGSPTNDDPIPSYTVVVGNIGTVYDGPDYRLASAEFGEYVSQSQTGYGRAAYEAVTLIEFKNGDERIIDEHLAERTTDDDGTPLLPCLVCRRRFARDQETVCASGIYCSRRCRQDHNVLSICRMRGPVHPSIFGAKDRDVADTLRIVSVVQRSYYRDVSPIDLWDNGSGPLWIYRESLGIVGVVRADAWESAYECVEDELMADYDEAEMDDDERRIAEDTGELPEGVSYRSNGIPSNPRLHSSLCQYDLNGNALDRLTDELAEELRIVIIAEPDDY